MKKALVVLTYASLQFIAFNAMAANPGDSVFVAVGRGAANNGNEQFGSGNAMQYGVNIGMDNGSSVRLLYANEGHPEKDTTETKAGHRDGVAALWALPLYSGSKVSFDVALGPYLSRNTIIRGGVQKNENKLGAMTQFTMSYLLIGNTSLTAGVNMVQVPGEFSTRALVLGVDYSFSSKKLGNAVRSMDWSGYQVSAWVGHSKTTLISADGYNNSAYQIEVKKSLNSNSNVAVSASLMKEGSTGVSGNGLLVQAWYDAPVTSNLTVSGGFGPYIAKRELGGSCITPVYTSRITYKITNSIAVGAQYSGDVAKSGADTLALGLTKTF